MYILIFYQNALVVIDCTTYVNKFLHGVFSEEPLQTFPYLGLWSPCGNPGKPGYLNTRIENETYVTYDIVVIIYCNIFLPLLQEEDESVKRRILRNR